MLDKGSGERAGDKAERVQLSGIISGGCLVGPSRCAGFFYARFWQGIVTLTLGLLTASCNPPYDASYVRMAVHLMHGDEPVNIDWVVECRYTARSGVMHGYVHGSVVPYVFGVKTKDGGMALVTAPYSCGQGWADKDYVPFLMWGDKAGDFTFFTAFVSREALQNPSSPLRFISAEMHPVDRAEFDTWKKTAPKNVVPGKRNTFLDDMRGSPATCLGFTELQLPPSASEVLRSERPNNGSPYWLAKRLPDVRIAGMAGLRGDKPYQGPLSEGLGVDRAMEEVPFPTYPEGDRDHIEAHFSAKSRAQTVGTDRVFIDAGLPGTMSCGAMPFDPHPHGSTLFEFRDGAAPPASLNSLDDLWIIKGIDVLYARRTVGFDVERGDPEDD